ncbi:hypothetical protein [Falsiroseomonas sp.]|uniref:hypothetical protein n=1 Tax=Falsiroseomonas sp. TaxID=2870721 RepID=UPI002735292A|nr:hypothetical protein [Falsiroseomonas sp.]MDP3415298.1 hypothetical protein [Falsiroseomonas sp.]
MTSSKHPKNDSAWAKGPGKDVPRPPSDLSDNPGIGQSKGVFGRGTNPKAIRGDTTFEGDVMNDTSRTGAVPPARQGRTNR